MRNKIKQICKKLEKQHNIRILFAVENGSRAWRMQSEDSDYDVRFVFVRLLQDYISINPTNEVIQVAFDKNGKQCAVDGSFIDVSGFDVFKYLKLLATSNPTAIEWLVTDIVYYGTQNIVFKKWAQQNFNPLTLYYHYKSLSKNNYTKYIKSGNDVTYKRYLYTFRGLINARFVAYKKAVPPIVFSDALNLLKDKLPKEVIKKILEIIEIKKSGEEKDQIERIRELDRYVENFLANDKEAPAPRARFDTTILDKELKKIVLKT